MRPAGASVCVGDETMMTLQQLMERAKTTEHGFKDLEAAAGEVCAARPAAGAMALALELLRSDVAQARCVGTFVLGMLAAAHLEALRVLKHEVSRDPDWRVQEILAKAFDRFCADTGYEAALPAIRDWLSDPHPNVRRAVTEGLRIWTGRPYFRDHPEIAVELLSRFRNDDSDYLRRSVGNALRDIGKKHPALISAAVASWDLGEPGTKQTWKLATRRTGPSRS